MVSSVALIFSWAALHEYGEAGISSNASEVASSTDLTAVLTACLLTCLPLQLLIAAHLQEGAADAQH